MKIYNIRTLLNFIYINSNKILGLITNNENERRSRERLLKGNHQFKFVNTNMCLNDKAFKPLLQSETVLSESLFNAFNKRLNYSL